MKVKEERMIKAACLVIFFKSVTTVTKMNEGMYARL